VSYRVIEQSCIPRNDRRPNEDAIVTTEWFAAIIDGATPKGVSDLEQRSGVDAATAVADTVQQLAPDADLEHFLLAATDRLGGLCARRDAWPAGTPAASALILSVRRREVWAVGDGWVGIGADLHHLTHALEHRLSDVRAARLTAALLEGASVETLRADDIGRAAIEPVLSQEWRFRNRQDVEWGFAMLDGTLPPIEMCRRFTLGNDAIEVRLASDGYPAIADDLAGTEALLRESISLDPLMITSFRATKGVAPAANSFDDRSFLRAELAPLE